MEKEIRHPPIIDKDDVSEKGRKEILPDINIFAEENRKNIDDYDDVQMAAISHDIGKFWQRADKRYARIPHEQLSKSFVGIIGLNRQVEYMVLSHMGNKYGGAQNSKTEYLTDIIKKSDSFSAKERKKEEGYTIPIDEPLVSIFSELKINEKNDTNEYYYPLTKLGLKNFQFPVVSKKGAMEGWNLRPNYNKIWKEFYEEINNVPNRYLSFDTLFYILKKYTFFMPSAVYGRQNTHTRPDISLFDHSKTTAAIASCIYKYMSENGAHNINDKTDYFIIISGDISGIQNFVYDVSSPQFAQKEMAKRLRGRSFYINLLNENLARIITEKIELNDSNILWCGGGHFLIIAPNTDNTRKILNDCERDMNKYLFEKYGGKLFLSLTYSHISGGKLGNFVSIKEKILFKNLKKKRQKYHSNLEMVFREEDNVPDNICKICGSISDIDMCKDCSTYEYIGDKITRAQYIIRCLVSNNDSSTECVFDFRELNVGYVFSEKENLLKELERISKLSSKTQVFKINDTDFLDIEIIKKLEEKNIQVSFGFSFIGNTVPIHEKLGLLSFEHIAKISRGTKKIGMLKMDIDNLAKLFEIGLGDMSSISRTSTMSSLLDTFMSGYINELLREYYVLTDICPECISKVDYINLTDDIKVYREKENNGKIEKVCNECIKKKIPIIYTCYSGGDDLLVLGPWDLVIKFSKDLRDIFKKYICMNKDINISAGIHICGPKFPMNRSANIVDDMLSRSKNLGKDRISIFSQTVRWDSFDRFKGYNELLQFADKLESLVNTGKISKSFVYSLLMLYNDIFGDLKEFDSEGDISNARLTRNSYISRLKYALARMIKNENKEYIKDLDKNLISERMLSWIEIPASVTILKWREK